MLVFIGFVALLLLGIFTLLGVLSMIAWNNSFGWHKGDFAPVIFFGAIGSFLVWLAFHLAPFSVTWGG